MNPNPSPPSDGRTRLTAENFPPASLDWLRFAPAFAIVCAGFAWLKSAQYHGHGQLRGEQMATVFFIALSVPCIVITLVRLPHYFRMGRMRMSAMLLACVIAMTSNFFAVWNLMTATVGAKDRLF